MDDENNRDRSFDNEAAGAPDASGRSPEGPRSDLDLRQESIEERMQLLSSPMFRRFFLQPAPSDECPTAQVMADYVEGSLSRRNRKQFEAHLNRCHTCLHVLGSACEEEPDASSVAPASVVSRMTRSGESAFSPNRKFTVWRAPLAAVAASFLTLFVVGYLSVARYGGGLVPDGSVSASMPEWHGTEASIFLHSSYIEQGNVRSEGAGVPRREKKVTPGDFLMIDLPLRVDARHWLFFLFEESGGLIHGFRVDPVDRPERYAATPLNPGAVTPSIDALNGIGLVEVEAGAILASAFGRITSVAVATRDRLGDDESRALVDGLTEALPAVRPGGRVAVRSLLRSRIEETPFMYGVDSIVYIQGAEGDDA